MKAVLCNRRFFTLLIISAISATSAGAAEQPSVSNDRTQSTAADAGVQTSRLSVALASSGSTVFNPTAQTADEAEPVVVEDHSVRAKARQLVDTAMSLIGVSYRLGGNTPTSGLDCSGFVRYVFHDVFGSELPRRAIELSHFGQKIKPTDLKPGDLVFYNTLRKAFSHVGIYLGNGRFIHSPSAGGEVRVEDMSVPYWAHRFDGARRMPEPSEK